MPSTWDRPRPRTYEYNYQLQTSQYTPTLSNLDAKKKEAQPKTYTVDRSSTTRGRTLQYPRTERITKYPPPGSEYKPFEKEEQTERKRMFYGPSSTGDECVPRRSAEDTGAALAAAKAKLAELEERQFPQRQPLWLKHPFYVHEDTVKVPPSVDITERPVLRYQCSLDDELDIQCISDSSVHTNIYEFAQESKEDSVWPEERPHFHLVSSYDLMVGYLGLPGMAQRAMERQRNQ